MSQDVEMDEMQEIVDDFLLEADELVEGLDNAFVKLESSPHDLDLLNEIFRSVHTIKGTSSFLGFEQVTTLSHKMEDVLNKLRKSELTVTSEIMDVLLQGLDQLKVLLDKVRERSNESVEIDDLVARLIALDEGGEASESGTEPVPPEPSASAETDQQVPEFEATPEPEAPSTAEDPLQEALKEEPSATAPETPAPAQPEGKPVGANKQPSGSQAPARKSGEQTIRVGVERLDSLMNMMGELVLGRNALVQSLGQLSQEHEGDYELEGVNGAAKGINFITTELQMAVMSMRMLPVGKVFSRFPRQVRDLSRETGKKIELHISGESTELDKSVIEEIGDPLMHIVRNSCDHGIEMPDKRLAAGKPEVGNVWLEAAQEGSNIVITIRDDGRGFDVDAIRDKAVAKGLARRDEVDRMPDAEVFRYIFEAGFSTAKKVTDISGRGVGMDVVRTNIEKLNGIIELDSVKGQGSTVSIKLPLTLAIVQGLLVECDDEIFILPLASVQETVKVEQARMFYVNQRPVFRLRNEIIPIVNLAHVLGRSPMGFEIDQKPYIVVVGLAEKKLGLAIDHFLGQEEVVIKALGDYLGSTEGIAGATILGDGRIRLIVDMIGLFKLARQIAN
jgi:two-component system chemotaxis sensor kinase CheA